jgi:hypothetical protein
MIFIFMNKNINIINILNELITKALYNNIDSPDKLILFRINYK